MLCEQRSQLKAEICTQIVENTNWKSEFVNPWTVFAHKSATATVAAAAFTSNVNGAHTFPKVGVRHIDPTEQSGNFSFSFLFCFPSPLTPAFSMFARDKEHNVKNWRKEKKRQ